MKINSTTKMVKGRSKKQHEGGEVLAKGGEDP